MTYPIYLEIGTKRTFAGMVDWPGWCRIGRDEESALQALVDTGPRYAHILQAAKIPFKPPTSSSALTIVERLEGNPTTDFGAPNIPLPGDERPVDHTELERLQLLLQAYWAAFDAAVAKASGKELRKGPRGGGRDLTGVIEHVLGSDQGYLTRLAVKPAKSATADDLQEQLVQTRQSMLRALTSAAQGQLPAHGPRGGVIWNACTFVRRVGWHVIDHAWEIEDRILS